MPAEAHRGILGTDHGQEGVMGMVHRLLMITIQVAAGAVFTPVEEVQRALVVPWDMVERVVKDFFRVEWVEGPYMTLSWVALEEVVVLTGMQQAQEEEADTPGGAVEIMNSIPVGAEEGPTTLEKISKVNVVIMQMAMVGSPLHCCNRDHTCEFHKPYI
ncbi:uncharacterized protein LOC111319689 [Stylophora pistillata]|uniref:Uncharacterized protein n=1 Tax=Stylophora pistillata TaxID=50429 RepID=A0A2B4QZ03_STYPI|nr:uncharacterized protein LOC111319689 [Stylophora pistillata]PFX11454.1 hypothetical protein AWC38_SpisGene24810 [Stylophora pistillata]